MLEQILKTLKKPKPQAASHSQTSSKRNLLNTEDFPEPDISASISQQQEEELADTLLAYAKTLPALEGIPDHPTLGKAPIETTLEAHAKGLASVVARGVSLYAAAGGKAALAVIDASKDPRLVVMFTEENGTDTARFDLFALLERRLLSEDGNSPNEALRGQCNYIAGLLTKGEWGERHQKMINSSYIGSPEGQLLIAWPLLTINGGSKMIPELQLVVEALRSE